MFLLLKALGDMFRVGFTGFKYKTPDGAAYRAPEIFVGAVPQRRGEMDEKAFPFIVNRLVDGEDGAQGSVVTVDTICGIFAGESIERGEIEIMNVMSRCRGLILSLPDNILDKRYRFEFPMKWFMGARENQYMQAHPFYGATIVTRWEVPAMENLTTLDEEINLYGSIN